MNHWAVSIFFSITLGFLIYIGGRFVFYKIVRKRAISFLEKIYFSNGESQKQEILDKFNKITNHQYTDWELTDYFLKIKGLQNFNKEGQSNFWIKHFLKQKTAIKLSYYEQVRFFKTFRHFPSKTKEQKTSKRESTQLKQAKTSIQISF